MIKNEQIIGLFPVIIGMYSLKEKFSEEEMEFFLNQKTEKNTFNKMSKNRFILEEKQLHTIKESIQMCINDYFHNTMSIEKEKANLYITQSWLNYTDFGESHQLHNHSNSILSGVLYIQTENDDRIIFQSDRNTFMSNFEKNADNIYNSDTWWLPSEPGKIYIFDSQLKHRVDVRFQNKTRISLAFNTFFRGTSGKIENSNSLTLY